MHSNLFAYFATTDAVYQKLLADTKADSQKLTFLQLLFGLSLIGALTDFGGASKALWFFAVLFGLQALQFFIDQSNRNFLLHWIEFERRLHAERNH